MRSEGGLLGRRDLWLCVGIPASARLAERAGAHTSGVSSYRASAELRSVADMSLACGVQGDHLARRVSLAAQRAAVLLDCDSGFGDEHIWWQAVEEIARTSEVADVCIEHKRFPKRNSFYRDGQVLQDISEFSRFIAAAAEVREAHHARPARDRADRGSGGGRHARRRGGQAGGLRGRWGRWLLHAGASIAVRAGGGAGVVIPANQMLRRALRAQMLAMSHLFSPDLAPAGLHDSTWAMGDVDDLVNRPGSERQTGPS